MEPPSEIALNAVVESMRQIYFKSAWGSEEVGVSGIHKLAVGRPVLYGWKAQGSFGIIETHERIMSTRTPPIGASISDEHCHSEGEINESAAVTECHGARSRGSATLINQRNIRGYDSAHIPE